MPLGTQPLRDVDTEFAALLADHEPSLRQLLRRLCGSAADADDVLQETLAKVWRLRRSYDPAGNGAAWLLQAAFRCYCDHRRRQRRQPRTDAGPDTIPAPARACASELRDELQHRLLPLSPIERALLLGFHAHGRSLQDLALEHGMPLNTIKSHLHRARQRLQENEP